MGWGREIIYLSQHCHHQNDSCIKMGSDESHFNVSVGGDGQSQMTVSTSHNLFVTCRVRASASLPQQGTDCTVRHPCLRSTLYCYMPRACLRLVTAPAALRLSIEMIICGLCHLAADQLSGPRSTTAAYIAVTIAIPIDLNPRTRPLSLPNTHCCFAWLTLVPETATACPPEHVLFRPDHPGP